MYAYHPAQHPTQVPHCFPGQPPLYWNPNLNLWQRRPPVRERVWTTFFITLFFGPFGLIPAILHTGSARRIGQPYAAYWITFCCTMFGCLVLLGMATH